MAETATEEPIANPANPMVPRPIRFRGTLSFWCRCGQQVEVTVENDADWVPCPKCHVWMGIVATPRLEPAGPPPIEPGKYVKLVEDVNLTPVPKRLDRTWSLKKGQVFRVGLDVYDGLDLGNQFVLLEYPSPANNGAPRKLLLPTPADKVEICDPPEDLADEPPSVVEDISVEETTPVTTQTPKIRRRT